MKPKDWDWVGRNILVPVLLLLLSTLNISDSCFKSKSHISYLIDNLVDLNLRNFDIVLISSSGQLGNYEIRRKYELLLENGHTFASSQGNPFTWSSELHGRIYVICHENETEFQDSLNSVSKILNSTSQINQHLLLSHIFLEWPMTEEDLENSKLLSILQDQNLKFSLQTNLYIFSTNRTSIWEFYHIKQKLIFKKLNGTNLSEMILRKLPRRQDFEGEIITAIGADIGEYPFEVTVQKESSLNGIKICKLLSGLSVTVFRDLKTMMNFTEAALCGGEIQVHSNGTMFGVSAGYFQQGIADILISHNTLRPLSAKVVHFPQPTRLQPVTAYSQRPSLKMRGTLFLDTFVDRLWISVICVCIGIILSFNAVLWVRSHVVKHPDELYGGSSFLETVSWMIGVVCQQGRHVFSSVVSVQVILITGHLTMVILYCAYTAKLVSNLSVKVPLIQEFEDFLTHKFEFIADVSSVSMAQYGKNLKLYYGNQMRQEEIKIVESQDLMKTLMESKSALLSFDDDMSRYYGWYSEYPDRFACAEILSLSAEKGFPTRHGMVLPKTSEFKEVFSYNIIILIERGLNYRYNTIYKKQTTPLCLQPSLGQLLEPTGLNEVASALLVFICGLLSSIIILSIERIIRPMPQRPKFVVP